MNYFSQKVGLPTQFGRITQLNNKDITQQLGSTYVSGQAKRQKTATIINEF